jgi:hypothetical protein
VTVMAVDIHRDRGGLEGRPTATLKIPNSPPSPR